MLPLQVESGVGSDIRYGLGWALEDDRMKLEVLGSDARLRMPQYVQEGLRRREEGTPSKYYPSAWLRISFD
jgi:hypothetical protein